MFAIRYIALVIGLLCGSWGFYQHETAKYVFQQQTGVMWMGVGAVFLLGWIILGVSRRGRSTASIEPSGAEYAEFLRWKAQRIDAENAAAMEDAAFRAWRQSQAK